MYTFRPATDRVWRMREAIRDRVLRCDADRMVILTEAYKLYDHIIPQIKRPLALKYLVERMGLYVGDDEIIFGCKGPHLFSSPQYPEWGISDYFVDAINNGEWTLREDGLYHSPDEEELKQCISPEDFKAICECREFWKYRKVGTMADAWQPEHHEELARLNVSSYVPEGGMGLISLPEGHLIAGYDKIINTGYAAIKKQDLDCMDAQRGGRNPY